jgi:hypothetical protein
MTSVKSTKDISARGRLRRRYLPPQHGAWAMLAVPYAVGLIAAGFRWPDLPLLGAWVAGYPLSYFALQTIKARRLGRYRAQLGFYAAIAAPLAVLAVIGAPALLRYVPVYIGLLAINCWYAYRRRERALLNDVASVVQSCVLVFAVATVAGLAPSEVVLAFGLCLAYFLGTVLFVKTMIRERADARYRWGSIAYHVVALGLAAFFSLWAAILFAWLLVRAVRLPGRALSPKEVGLLELANSVTVVVVVALL